MLKLKLKIKNLVTFFWHCLNFTSERDLVSHFSKGRIHLDPFYFYHECSFLHFENFLLKHFFSWGTLCTWKPFDKFNFCNFFLIFSRYAGSISQNRYYLFKMISFEVRTNAPPFYFYFCNSVIISDKIVIISIANFGFF